MRIKDTGEFERIERGEIGWSRKWLFLLTRNS